MSKPPKDVDIDCPECGGLCVAVIPEGSALVSGESDFDGKVRVNCSTCEDQFSAFFASTQ